LEVLAHPPTANDTTIAYDDPGIFHRGTWTLDNGFRVADKFSAALRVMFFGKGDESFTFGTGPDHSLFDVYIGGSLWHSYDGYADTEDERTVGISLTGDGPHTFEIRNRLASDET
jgi:hypothetical protein